MLAWLSDWSDVQTCIQPSWCHCHSQSLASIKSRLVLPFWYRLNPDSPGQRAVKRVCVCVWGELNVHSVKFASLVLSLAAFLRLLMLAVWLNDNTERRRAFACVDTSWESAAADERASESARHEHVVSGGELRQRWRQRRLNLRDKETLQAGHGKTYAFVQWISLLVLMCNCSRVMFAGYPPGSWNLKAANSRPWKPWNMIFCFYWIMEGCSIELLCVLLWIPVTLLCIPLITRFRWLGSRVVSVLDSGAVGPGFKSQPQRCRLTVLGKLCVCSLSSEIGSSPLKGCEGNCRPAGK